MLEVGILRVHAVQTGAAHEAFGGRGGYGSFCDFGEDFNLNADPAIGAAIQPAAGVDLHVVAGTARLRRFVHPPLDGEGRTGQCAFRSA